MGVVGVREIIKQSSMKQSKWFERYFKGMANYHRLDILMLVDKSPGITVEGISERLDVQFSTIAVHAQKLMQVGLLEKTYVGRSVAHKLSPYGKKFLSFMHTF